MKASHIFISLFIFSAIIAVVDAFNVSHVMTNEMLAEGEPAGAAILAESDIVESDIQYNDVSSNDHFYNDEKISKSDNTDYAADLVEVDSGVNIENTAFVESDDYQTYTAQKTPYSSSASRLQSNRSPVSSYRGGNVSATSTAQATPISRAQRSARNNAETANAPVIHDEFGNEVDNNYDATGNVVNRFECPKMLYLGGSA